MDRSEKLDHTYLEYSRSHPGTCGLVVAKTFNSTHKFADKDIVLKKFLNKKVT